ncbi:hypothetical protein CYMTET_7707 [Cymbomonas tetramitiformis]|uniref:Uncharacterized protein n=1 Tax=Cymbomonas tetramitiformis TaxID=36881 RepID=A0AAE0GUX4_9CHLO|nr:hypothetical protein CYMTET_7707 [Cymbomonas tetramitiformis]
MRAARAASNASGAVQALSDARARAKQKLKRQQVVRIKIISMGDAGVGKSCLIKRYCEEKFVQKYIGTIGVDYGVKSVRLGNWDLRVNLWDLAGGSEYFEVRNEFYRDAQGCMLVYDCTSRNSFEALDSWIDESARFGAQNAIVVVAANKVDVGRRVVSEKEGRQWAESNGFLFFEVSANSGAQVRAMFASIFHRVLHSMQGVDEDLTTAAGQLAQTELFRGQEGNPEEGKARRISGARN